ncbi:hypothetical protein ACFQ0B_69430 [Nonomuraea thailandensis]
MTFPPEVVADAERYREAATLPAVDVEAAVARRRDLAVDGFHRLAEGGPEALRRFYDSAVALVRPKVAGWRGIWESTVAEQARRTAGILDALARGDGAHLQESALMESPPQERWGMCGHLRAHDVADPVVR